MLSSIQFCLLLTAPAGGLPAAGRTQLGHRHIFPDLFRNNAMGDVVFPMHVVAGELGDIVGPARVADRTESFLFRRIAESGITRDVASQADLHPIHHFPRNPAIHGVMQPMLLGIGDKRRVI